MSPLCFALAALTIAAASGPRWFGGADLALAAEAAKLRAIIVTPDGDAGF